METQPNPYKIEDQVVVSEEGGRAFFIEKRNYQDGTVKYARFVEERDRVGILGTSEGSEVSSDLALDQEEAKADYEAALARRNQK